MRNKLEYKNNKSGVTGVSWYPSSEKWRAKITVDKKQISLGYFHSLKDASKARWGAEVKYDFPNCNSTSSAYTYLKKEGVIE
jgi:hypothetical protein